MKVAIYPGSFDPITEGHLDIIKRASRIFDRVIVGVLVNQSKTPLFTIDERVEMIGKSVAEISNVEVRSFKGLLTDYVKNNDIDVIIKGLRAISDFESEFQMAIINRKLNENAETCFLMTDMKYAHLSSSIVKEVYSLGGDISQFVPKIVLENMKKRCKVYE